MVEGNVHAVVYNCTVKVLSVAQVSVYIVNKCTVKVLIVAEKVSVYIVYKCTV